MPLILKKLKYKLDIESLSLKGLIGIIKKYLIKYFMMAGLNQSEYA